MGFGHSNCSLSSLCWTFSTCVQLYSFFIHSSIFSLSFPHHLFTVQPAAGAAAAAAVAGAAGSHRSPGAGGRSTWLQPGQHLAARPREETHPHPSASHIRKGENLGKLEEKYGKIEMIKQVGMEKVLEKNRTLSNSSQSWAFFAKFEPLSSSRIWEAFGRCNSLMQWCRDTSR